MLRQQRTPAWTCLPLSCVIVKAQILLLLIAAAAISVFGFSCRTAGTGVRPATAIVVPEWDALNIQSLGLVTVGSSAGEEFNRQTAESILEEQLSSSQDRFVVLGVQAVRNRAASAGAGELFDRVAKTWRDQRMTDKFLVQELCQKAGVDGIILGDLIDWKREKVDFTQEGTSYTLISMRLVIISGKTGLQAWEARKTIRRDTLVYTPGGGGSGITTDDSGISRAQRSGSMTPDPPRPEEVLTDVLASVFAAFPPRPEP
jgi:hypothetical protein